MNCVYCGHDTQVTNSRLQKRSNGVWRRRHCATCNSVFTSIEMVDLAQSVRFSTGKGNLVPFQRDKLFLSIYESCRHRPDASTSAAALTQTVLTKLRPAFKSTAVERTKVIDAVHTTL